MIIAKTTAAFTKALNAVRKPGQQIGFVPTMGALHAGHLSLIEAARAENTTVACSIFVNPTQFNNKQDFEKYPSTLETDIRVLENNGCDILFLPSVSEMYPAGESGKTYNLGYLEFILEGKFRPGHFQGVCQIVDKLLAICKPDTLYLGQKDYQQCMVIRKMMELEGYQNALHIVETMREPSGLAMSSRNMRLTPTARTQATAIYQALDYIKTNLVKGSTTHLTTDASLLLKQKGFNVDYVTVADAKTLMPADSWNGETPVVTLAAAWLKDIRLIDNLLIH